jgi:hypothetical protein
MFVISLMILLLVYEKAESSGRYICPDRISTKDLLSVLKKSRPYYN